jgi:hypothetical protein
VGFLYNFFKCEILYPLSQAVHCVLEAEGVIKRRVRNNREDDDDGFEYLKN